MRDMAFSSKKDKDFKKAQYYVWYLGWRECRGLRGREHTDPVVREFLQKRHNDDLQTLTLEVTKKDIKMFQQVEKKKNKIEKVNYAPIPSKDVTFATQLDSPDDDVVACIYLGYNPETRCAVHAHVYRCDCADTAATLVRQLNYLIHLPDHQQRVGKIEADLVQKGQIAPPRNINNNNNGTSASLTSSGHSTRSSGSSHSDPRDPDLDKDAEKDMPFSSVTEELKIKLKDRTSAPLLLPPKDYDTLCLKHGRVEKAFLNKSLNVDIVGEAGGVWGDALERERIYSTTGSSEHGSSQRNSRTSIGDVPSPSSDRGQQFKTSLDDRFRNSLNLQNSGNEQRLSGPRSNSTASSPSSTLARDPFHSPRGSHHSSPQGTLDSRQWDNGFMLPRSPNTQHRPGGYQNGQQMLKRMSSDDSYSSVHDRDYPPVFYHPDGYPRDRMPSSPRNSSRGGSKEHIPGSASEDIRRSREFIPPNSPYPYPAGPQGHPDMTQSLPDKVLREYQMREEAKHSKDKSKDKSKKSDKKDKKGKDKLKSNHARSHSEEVVPIPQPDYDITLRVPNKPVTRVSSVNYR